MKLSARRRKLDDFVRQFGLGQPDLDRVTDYLADQVWNRHARSIGRPWKTAHPFLVERIDWESIYAELHNVRGGSHVSSFHYSLSDFAAKVLENFRATGRGLGFWEFNI